VHAAMQWNQCFRIHRRTGSHHSVQQYTWRVPDSTNLPVASGAVAKSCRHSFQQQPCWCDALPSNGRRAMYRHVQHNHWCSVGGPSQRRGVGALSLEDSAQNSPRGRTPSWRTSIVARIVYCWFVALVFSACAMVCSDLSPLSTPSAWLMQHYICGRQSFPAQHVCVDGTGSGASAAL